MHGPDPRPFETKQVSCRCWHSWIHRRWWQRRWKVKSRQCLALFMFFAIIIFLHYRFCLDSVTQKGWSRDNVSSSNLKTKGYIVRVCYVRGKDCFQQLLSTGRTLLCTTWWLSTWLQFSSVRNPLYFLMIADWNLSTLCSYATPNYLFSICKIVVQV